MIALRFAMDAAGTERSGGGVYDQLEWDGPSELVCVRPEAFSSVWGGMTENWAKTAGGRRRGWVRFDLELIISQQQQAMKRGSVLCPKRQLWSGSDRL